MSAPLADRWRRERLALSVDRAAHRDRTREVSSGGPSSAKALDPLAERVRLSLVRLAAIYADPSTPSRKAFNPDEPRDPAGTSTGGEWTSGGGDGDLAEISAKYPGTQFEFGPRLDEARCTEALREFDRLKQQFPGVLVTKVRTGSLPGATVAETMWERNPLDHGMRRVEITLNSRYFGGNPGKDPQKSWPGGKMSPMMARMLPAGLGWNPAGCSTPGAVMAHEFGHAAWCADLWGRADAGMTGKDNSPQYLNDFVDGLQAANRDHAVSAYGVTGGAKETIAEAFAAAYYTNSDVPRDDPWVTTVQKWADASPYLRPSANKYSEDEPRDERGRWTAGGASSGPLPDLVAVGTEYLGPERSPSPVNDRIHEAAMAASDAMVGMKPGEMARYVEQQTGVPVTLAGSRPNRDALREGLAQFVALKQAFPAVPVKAIELTPLRPPNLIARTEWSGYKPESVIRLSSARWAQSNQSYGTPGWFTPGNDNPAGTMTHEFGHALDHWSLFTAGTQEPGTPSGFRVSRDGFSAYYPISGYGATSDQERFAELFAATYASPTAPESQQRGMRGWVDWLMSADAGA